jgi:hypothetical protein
MTTELQRAPTLPPFNSSHSMKAMCARQAIEALWQELENCRVHRHRNGNGDTNSSAASTGRCKVRPNGRLDPGDHAVVRDLFRVTADRGGERGSMTTLNTIEAAGQALAEASHERRLRDLFQHLPIKLDVKNEARVHLRYEDRFGYAIKPYLSSADAIATFPTTATAVGVRRICGKLECCTPFGLDDLFGLLVRPNKRQITRAIYEAKVDRWRPIWPRLTYLPWEEAIPGQ